MEFFQTIPGPFLSSQKKLAGQLVDVFEGGKKFPGAALKEAVAVRTCDWIAGRQTVGAILKQARAVRAFKRYGLVILMQMFNHGPPRSSRSAASCAAMVAQAAQVCFIDWPNPLESK